MLHCTKNPQKQTEQITVCKPVTKSKMKHDVIIITNTTQNSLQSPHALKLLKVTDQLKMCKFNSQMAFQLRKKHTGYIHTING